MEFEEFIRKPFVVEAVRVTEENIADIAEYVGDLREYNGQTYIRVDRRLVPKVARVEPGFWMTRMGDNIRCYSDEIFRAQFTHITPEVKSWIEYLEQEGEPVV